MQGGRAGSGPSIRPACHGRECSPGGGHQGLRRPACASRLCPPPARAMRGPDAPARHQCASARGGIAAPCPRAAFKAGHRWAQVAPEAGAGPARLSNSGRSWACPPRLHSARPPAGVSAPSPGSLSAAGQVMRWGESSRIRTPVPGRPRKAVARHGHARGRARRGHSSSVIARRSKCAGRGQTAPPLRRQAMLHSRPPASGSEAGTQASPRRQASRRYCCALARTKPSSAARRRRPGQSMPAATT